MSKQYDEFLSKENFELAFNRIKYSSRSRYKNFYRSDIDSFGMFLTQNIDQIRADIRGRKYEPIKIERFYVPKKNNLARPMSLLYFIDYLVYQALCNILEKYSEEGRSYYFNNYAFANIPNKGNSEKFQYKNWRHQWKVFKEKIKKYYKEGYNYIAEFDIASFYDTIDHSILREVLIKIGIEKEILDLLDNCLESWSVTNTEAGFKKHCGIPQGPDCSGTIAEIYLSYIDSKFLAHNKFKYFRYADDIRIMTKSKLECQKAISLLDLYCKDISLIAQNSKLSIVKINSNRKFNEYVDTTGLKFSSINLEFKSFNHLKESTHNKLKRKLINAFDDDKSKLYLNKTILKFVFYKLNRDDEIKELILEHWDELYLNFEGVVFYLNKYYCEDESIIDKIRSVLINDDILYQYNKAIIFSEFEHLKYDQTVYEALRNNRADRFWIIKYYAMRWLYRNKKTNLIRHLFDNCNKNYFIERDILFYEYLTTSDEDERKQLILSCYGKESMIALRAFNLQIIEGDYTNDNCSDYILNIFNLDKSDYIMKHMKNNYKLLNKECKGFVNVLKNDAAKYWKAIEVLNNYERSINSLPDNALLNLDSFHNIILDILLPEMESEFGVKIEHIKSNYSCAYSVFSKIHEARNQETSAHYKDKNGNVGIAITQERLIKLINKPLLGKAYAELFASFN